MDSELLRQLGPVIESGDNRGRAGHWDLYTPTSNIVVSITRGHMDLAFSHGLERVRATLLRTPGMITVFHDWEDSITYDHEFRANNARTGSLIADRMSAIFVLARKGLVAMGVSTVALTLSEKAPVMVETFFERPRFEAQLKSSLANR